MGNKTNVVILCYFVFRYSIEFKRIFLVTIASKSLDRGLSHWGRSVIEVLLGHYRVGDHSSFND